MADLSTLAPAVERPLAYRWLAGLFSSELTAETLKAYGGPDGRVALTSLEDEPAFRPVVARIRALASEPDRLRDRALDLAADYSLLFLGVGGPRTAHPYASAYLSDKGTLFQGPTSEMAEMLRRLDIAVVDTMKEPPDHIAIELSVVAELAERAEAAALRGDRQEAMRLKAEQAAFIDTQLLSWVLAFAADCREHDRSGFYADLAAALTAYLHTDRERLTAPATSG
ncbi:TorA-specific chaperone [Rhodobium orientis]|uniref:Molecular chaperone TorD n=1 Tax=Rhodobium orientis TaxID=34017 RepID=A0A327JW25_9HYPH|nr:molecular chaperone TorD [Rhodobium orientis]MBB4302735.1 TorA-specific chaperone [Rhodobium orientis]MBK5948516.1 molecular chaperone TorD [Rhodobium orientis]RAI29785.1 molecular chaperone TorD [Rhodobium orientis]